MRDPSFLPKNTGQGSSQDRSILSPERKPLHDRVFEKKLRTSDQIPNSLDLEILLSYFFLDLRTC